MNKRSIKYVEIKIRLETPNGSKFFGTGNGEPDGDRINEPLATQGRKTVLLQVLRKLVAALEAGEKSISVSTDAAGLRIIGDDPSALIDLNKATKTKLIELPGVGPVRAAKIIEHRPYESVDELVVKIDDMDEELVNRIRSLVTVTSE